MALDDDLDPDALELLNQLAPPVDTTIDDIDDIVLGEETEEDETAHPAGYVPKAEFDRIAGKVDALTALLTSRDAAAPAAAPAPLPTHTPAPGPTVNHAELEKTLNDRFFDNPTALVTALVQTALANERAQNSRNQIERDASSARTSIASLRTEFANEYPEYRSVLKDMDQMILETSPEVLAQLVSSGRLRSVYEDNFMSKAGRVAIKVNRAGVSRRAPAKTNEEPPSLGGRGNVTPIARGNRVGGGKEIRMSDLNEIDQEAVRQAKKLNFSDAEIRRMLSETG